MIEKLLLFAEHLCHLLVYGFAGMIHDIVWEVAHLLKKLK